MRGQRLLLVSKSAEVDDAPDSGGFGGGAEIARRVSIILFEGPARTHRVDQVVGDVDSAHGLIEAGAIQHVSTGDLGRATYLGLEKLRPPRQAANSMPPQFEGLQQAAPDVTRRARQQDQSRVRPCRRGLLFNHSDSSRVIRPLKQGLSLAGSAIEHSSRAILSELGNVTLGGAPSLDLALVVNAPAARVVAAIPLEPTARIFVIYPALLFPNRQRLRRGHFEEVLRGIMAIGV